MNTNNQSPLSRGTCILLHLKSRINARHPLRSAAFHLFGIAREFLPKRGMRG